MDDADGDSHLICCVIVSDGLSGRPIRHGNRNGTSISFEFYFLFTLFAFIFGGSSNRIRIGLSEEIFGFRSNSLFKIAE